MRKIIRCVRMPFFIPSKKLSSWFNPENYLNFHQKMELFRRLSDLIILCTLNMLLYIRDLSIYLFMQLLEPWQKNQDMSVSNPSIGLCVHSASDSLLSRDSGSNQLLFSKGNVSHYLVHYFTKLLFNILAILGYRFNFSWFMLQNFPVDKSRYSSILFNLKQIYLSILQHVMVHAKFKIVVKCFIIKWLQLLQPQSLVQNKTELLTMQFSFANPG